MTSQRRQHRVRAGNGKNAGDLIAQRWPDQRDGNDCLEQRTRMSIFSKHGRYAR